MTFRPFRVTNTMTQQVAETAGKEYGMYIKTMENRKVLVKRLERLTGTKAVYTRMPECAFEVGDFKVERYGTLVIGDEADAEVVETLLAEGLIAEYVPEPEPEPEKEPEPSRVEVSFPMEEHTARSLKNLAAMLYSRGRLISKSTGGEFSCSEKQMETLKGADTVPAFLDAVREDLKGITFTGDALTFTGFPETKSTSRIRTFTQLATMMNALSIQQGRVLAREVDGSNERYIFRIWLLHLGMEGESYKEARRILLAPLSGNKAFRTPENETQFRERLKERRSL